MDIDRGLKIRIAISAVLAVALLAYFVERLSYRNVVATPREPASAHERVIESCEGRKCATAPEFNDENAAELKSTDGALIHVPTTTTGA